MKKCLIVIDFQVDFVSGSLGFPQAPALESFIADKIRSYREQGGEIIFTFDTHGEDYLATQEGRNLPVPHCLSGTPGHALYGEIAQLRQDEDKCFYKNSFPSAELYEYLRGQEYSSIELAGLVSNICVVANAVLAKTAQPETPLLVDARCTSCHSPKLNEAALDILASLQVEIINREGVV